MSTYLLPLCLLGILIRGCAVLEGYLSNHTKTIGVGRDYIRPSLPQPVCDGNFAML